MRLACLPLALAALFSGLWLTTMLAAARDEAPVTRAAKSGEIAATDLPREARETLMLIRHGGPFPHRQDGVTFGNREKLLPARPRGYYREYTVSTPGAKDRGARRIVSGSGGDQKDADEFWYTEDHYKSFQRIKLKKKKE